MLELHLKAWRNFAWLRRLVHCRGAADLREQSPDGASCAPQRYRETDVVLYEELLDDGTVTAAVRAIASADLLVIAGTSLAVLGRGPHRLLQRRSFGHHHRTPTPARRPC